MEENSPGVLSDCCIGEMQLRKLNVPTCACAYSMREMRKADGSQTPPPSLHGTKAGGGWSKSSCELSKLIAKLLSIYCLAGTKSFVLKNYDNSKIYLKCDN